MFKKFWLTLQLIKTLEMDKYYKCGRDSATGKLLAKFWSQAIKASRKAEAYAKSMGAKAYIQPVQYFEGGVEYLEFDKEPDPEVWRRKDFGDFVAYEPNCRAVNGLLPVDDARFVPSDTWNRIYSKDTIEKDGKKFYAYVEFCGDQKPKRGKSPGALRKAVKAERLRLALPVVRIDRLYSILGFQLPKDGKEMGKAAKGTVTPVFFVQGDHYYIKAQCECGAPDLEPVTSKVFSQHKDLALSADSREADDFDSEYFG